MPDSSLTQGAALPDVTQTTTKTTEAPQYYQDYLGGLAQVGAQELAKTPEQLVAPMTELQKQGYAAVPGASTAYQPGLAAATQTAGEATGVSAGDINQFMNPYTTNVVQEMERLAQQNIQRNVLPGLKAGFVGSGDLGSRRYAGALGQSMGDIQKTLTGQQYGALSEGYKTALDAALREQQNQIAAAKEQADLAAQAQTLGLTGAGAMTKAGAEQQAYEQSLLEAPLKQATNVAKLMAGQNIPLTTTEKFVGPKAGLYQKSPLESILSVGSLLGAAKEGTALGKFTDWLGKSISSIGGDGGVAPDWWKSLTPDEQQKWADIWSGDYGTNDNTQTTDNGTTDTGTTDTTTTDTTTTDTGNVP